MRFIGLRRGVSMAITGSIGAYATIQPHHMQWCQPKGSIAKDSDCEIPACNSVMEMFAIAKKNKKKKSSKRERTENPYTEGCPVTRGELGVSTWNLIHTIAANYPDNPSEDVQLSTSRFFESLADVYPCPHCAADFRESLDRTPPDVSSRVALSMWSCQLHNEVNEKLGLPLFPCNMEELDLRWRIGREDCWDRGDEIRSTDPTS